jgi:hypothetical protein
MIVQDEKRFRLDYAKLEKGMFIGPEALEEAFGLSREDDEFQWKVLSLITEARRELRETEVTVVQRHRGILVLSDDEATEYQNSRFVGGIRQAVDAHDKARRINPEALNEQQRKVHERRVINQSRIVQAIRRK